MHLTCNQDMVGSSPALSSFIFSSRLRAGQQFLELLIVVRIHGGKRVV